MSQVALADPDVAGVGLFTGTTGGAQTANTGRGFIVLKPRDERVLTSSQVIDRLRPQLAKVEGATLFLQPSQDITVGGRIARASFQYTLQDTDIAELAEWSDKLLEKMRTLPELADAATDLSANAPQLKITITRDPAGAAARSGLAQSHLRQITPDRRRRPALRAGERRLRQGRPAIDRAPRAISGGDADVQSAARRCAWTGG